jgi:hypothetical protein
VAYGQHHLSGSDALGAYTGVELNWLCGSSPFATSVRLYSDHALGEFAIFAQRWPNGANQTAAAPPSLDNVGDPRNSQERVSSVFPAFAPQPSSASKNMSYFVYHNQMLGGMLDGTKYGAWSTEAIRASGGVPGGTMGGPLVVFGSAPSAFAVVIAPVTNPMAMNLRWRNASASVDGALQVGVLGSISAIPVGYVAESILFLGGASAASCTPFAPGGVNCAVYGFGEVLREYKGAKPANMPASASAAAARRAPRPPVVANDTTRGQLGYYTDNGAYFYYYSTPRPGAANATSYGADLRAIHSVEVEQRGVPFTYVQLDSYWYFKGAHNGVLNWSATPATFPRGLGSLRDDTRWPVVAHNRYWGDLTPYATANGGQYEFIVERDRHRSIPASQQFWDELFANKTARWGLAVYEQDWLHNEWESLDATLSSATRAQTWLTQMNDGALRSDVAIQYCMAYARHALASAALAAVTQVRASDDYATGVRVGDTNNANLFVGTSSLLAGALGLAPSKDVWWSNATTRYPKRAKCRYADATEPFPEVQGAVAALSAGPVAPGDAIGAANKSLIMRTCRADGTLLSPSLPATPVEAVFARRAAGHWLPSAVEVNAAYTVLPASPGPGAAAAPGRSGFGAPGSTVYAAVIAIDLPSALELTASELGFGAGAQLVAWRARDGAASAALASHVTMRPCAKVDFDLVYVSALGARAGAGDSAGPALLGEADKFVPVSPTRFTSWNVEAGRGVATLRGVAGERVDVAFWSEGKVVSAACVVGASGDATVAVRKGVATCA